MDDDDNGYVDEQEDIPEITFLIGKTVFTQSVTDDTEVVTGRFIISLVESVETE